MATRDQEQLGNAIAGGLIATATFRTLVEKGLLTPEEASGILKRAIAAVENSSIIEEQCASTLLKSLARQINA